MAAVVVDAGDHHPPDGGRHHPDEGHDLATERGEVAASHGIVADVALPGIEREAAVDLVTEREIDPGVAHANLEVSQMTGKKIAAPRVALGRRRRLVLQGLAPSPPGTLNPRVALRVPDSLQTTTKIRRMGT